MVWYEMVLGAGTNGLPAKIRAMAIKSLENRITDAFGSTGSFEFGDRYLELLLTNWREVQATVRRTTATIVILAAAFPLINTSRAHPDLSLGPLRVAGAAVILVILPAIISFRCVELCALQADTVRYRILVGALIKTLYPSVWENDLQLTLRPADHPLWGTNPRQAMRSSTRGKSAHNLESANILLGMAIIVGPIMFLLYAYWQLVFHVPISAVPVAASGIVSLFNVIRAALLIRDEISSGAWVDLAVTHSISQVG